MHHATQKPPDLNVPHPDALMRFARRLVGEDVVLSVLDGGRTNYCVRASSATAPNRGDVVIKTYDPTRANRLFPNDPKAEWEALNDVMGTGLGPRPVARHAEGDAQFVAYRHVVGSALIRLSREAVAALKQVHHIRPTHKLRQVDTSIAAIQRDGEALLAAALHAPDLNGTVKAQIEALNRSRPSAQTGSALPAAQGKFLHGDPTPANIVSHEWGVTFVDWQCPAVGDPCHDLSIAFSPAMHEIYGRVSFTHADGAALLGAYGDASVEARYLQLQPILSWRIASYCLCKAAFGERDYEAAAEAELTS